jgi:hypothetical protein
VDHRLGTLTLEGCKKVIKCTPKTAVILNQFASHLHGMIQKKMRLVDGEQVELSDIETQLWNAFLKIIQNE